MGDPVHVTSANDQCIKWTDIKPQLNKNITGFICRLVPEDAVWLINLIFKKRWWRVVMTIILISASYTWNHEIVMRKKKHQNFSKMKNKINPTFLKPDVNNF